jgi:spermidine synthase
MLKDTLHKSAPQLTPGIEVPRAVGGDVPAPSRFRARCELFLVSLLILFLELACIRWFAAHVLFLTFFTNTVLLACFVGMSVGCLAASRERDFRLWTPFLLAFAMASAHGVEFLRSRVEKLVVVGNQISPQLVFFGTEYVTPDPAGFFIPVELLGGFFFVVIALTFVGPGQGLGRAFERVPERVEAYSLNILGSLVGIMLFALASWRELTPFWWFLFPVAVFGYLLKDTFAGHGSWAAWALRAALAGALMAVLGLAFLTAGDLKIGNRGAGQHLWSPYYRVDYDPSRRSITVNLITHQDMVPRDDDSSPAYAYALPHILHRDAGGRAWEDVLIIGAGTGNDVSRALQWGAKHVDAVEIDPLILRLGRFHPDQPYQDQRVRVHVDDGRNFLRATDRKYDLILYALVDSLVLHSSYSNIRLESFLFTRQAFADVQRHLKPNGVFVVYNFFRQGWIVARIYKTLTEVFGSEPLVLTLPSRTAIEPLTSGGFTVFFAGDTVHIREAFRKNPRYWLPHGKAPGPALANGFDQAPSPQQTRAWRLFQLAEVRIPQELRSPTDDWPFLYLRRPMIPSLSQRAMVIMGGLAFLLVFLFRPSGPQGRGRWRVDPRMFFLGAGFMLIETKAVVHMALLFGSTWIVNSVVFFAVLTMILGANLFVLRFRPTHLTTFYAGLLVSLGLNILIPLDSFLGMPRVLQVSLSCLLVFAPILFAGVIFAVCFGRSADPARDFGTNTAGAMFGGLAEYSSMLVGFQYLMLLAAVFYALSAIAHRDSASIQDPVQTLNS